MDRRDREVATCYARAEAREMARLSEARTHMPGVDEALSATGALNELRAQDNRPAHQLSARLTEHALDMLGDQTSRTLDDFTRAFEQFERTSPGQNFIEHYARERAFIPGGSNSAPPPEPGALTPELQQLLSLAAEVMERDYALPFGTESTVSADGQEWLAEAIRAALDGDLEMLRAGRDPEALAALRLQRDQQAQAADERASSDAQAAQQQLMEAEEAARQFLSALEAPLPEETRAEGSRAPSSGTSASAEAEEAARRFLSDLQTIPEESAGRSDSGPTDSNIEITSWPACIERFQNPWGTWAYRNNCARYVLVYARERNGNYRRISSHQPGREWAGWFGYSPPFPFTFCIFSIQNFSEEEWNACNEYFGYESP